MSVRGAGGFISFPGVKTAEFQSSSTVEYWITEIPWWNARRGLLFPGNGWTCFFKDEGMMEDQDRKSDGRDFNEISPVFCLLLACFDTFAQARGLHHNEQHCICSPSVVFHTPMVDQVFWRRPISCVALVIMVLCKSMGWFLEPCHGRWYFSLFSETPGWISECLLGVFFPAGKFWETLGEMDFPFLKRFFLFGFPQFFSCKKKTPSCRLSGLLCTAFLTGCSYCAWKAPSWSSKPAPWGADLMGMMGIYDEFDDLMMAWNADSLHFFLQQKVHDEDIHFQEMRFFFQSNAAHVIWQISFSLALN